MNDAPTKFSDGTDLTSIVEQWLNSFEAAIVAGEFEAAAKLFHANSHWRDVVALTWNIECRSRGDAIREALAMASVRSLPREFRVAAGRTKPRMVKRAGTETLEAIFSFETAYGRASGVVRLVPDNTAAPGWSAWMLSTVLDDLSKCSGAPKSLRPPTNDEGRTFGGDNWLDRRRKRETFADREPACVVVGAGQAGLAIAARLGALGVDTLVIDRHERVGDNWRKRYHALTLHNEVFVNHFPYMPFPDTWPVYIPKDKLAGWFEMYAEAMELNVWTGTALSSGEYDEAAGQWTLKLECADGSVRLVRPRHVVLATGVSAIPIWPELSGLDEFQGEIMHSGEFTSGEAWRHKKVLIVGTGTSAHDVAQDLEASGSDVTLLQRSPTYVVSLKQAQKVYSIYQEGPSVEDCDLLATTSAYPVLIKSYQLSTEEMKVADQALLDRLAARGFRLNMGDPDKTGFQMQYMRRGGGYYFNVGCSERVADGKVGLMKFGDIERFCNSGALLKDGSVKPADLIVVATGYLNQQESVRRFFGNDVADRVGHVWGFDDGGELANMWKRTPQPGLWFTAGSLAQSRIYSRYLALQIKGVELGLIDKTAPPVPANGVLAAEAAVFK